MAWVFLLVVAMLPLVHGGTLSNTTACWSLGSSVAVPATSNARFMAGLGLAQRGDLLVVGAPSVEVNQPTGKTPYLRGQAYVYKV